jgi:flagellar motor switch protein FliN/FliY
MTALEEIAHLADIRVDVEAELDRITMTIENILALDTGSVIRTNRSAGENIDLMIGGARVGSGEVVIIEETVAVRITDFSEEA